MLLQLLLALPSLRSHAVPALGIALPHFSEQENEATHGRRGGGLREGNGDDELLVKTVTKEFHENVPLILRRPKQPKHTSTSEMERNQECEGNCGEAVVAKDPHDDFVNRDVKGFEEGHDNNIIDKDIVDHHDRGKNARIVNTQGQRRNPTYLGAGSRKSIKLNKPSTFPNQDSYDPYYYSKVPRFVTCFSPQGFT